MAAENTIKDRVIKLESEIPSIHTQMGVMDERTNTISTKADGLYRAFYGFDKTPGLLHDVTNLIEKMNDVKRLMWAIFIVVMGIAAGGIYEAIIHAALASK